MGAHAFLPPSSAVRWSRCALSASLEAAYPETEESPESMEGTAAHWTVQMLLQGTPAALGMQAPNGVAVTEEMLEAAEVVREDIVATLGPDFAQYLIIERRVHMPRIHPTLNWGTPDYRAWSRLNNGKLCLNIWDFKYGFGVVEVFENEQLIDYTEGCLHEAQIDGLQDQEIVVNLVVVQPRAPHRQGPVRNWRVMASDLRPYINRLANAAGAACAPNPPATPTPEGCEHCRGRHACEALQKAAFKHVAKGQHHSPLDLTPHALGLELRALERGQALVEARISGLKAQAEMSIRQGNLVPFWSLDSVPGRLAWTRPVAEVFAFGDMMGLDLRKEPDAITPTQAKAAAKRAKLPEEMFAGFSERPSGAVKLAYDDGTKARLTFTKL